MQDLNIQEPIVDPATGTPNSYFIRLLQGRGIGQEDTAEIVDALVARSIVPGDATIQVTNGSLAADGDIKIFAEVQALLDQLSTTQGAVLFRAATHWTYLPPGTSGDALLTRGAGADPHWGTAGADIQALLDGISATRGVILYRGASGWVALAPGTAGDVLSTGGAGADPSWAAKGIPDAPSDGTTYGRKNAAWVAVTGGGGTVAYRPLVDGSTPPNLMYEPDGSLIMEAFTP